MSEKKQDIVTPSRTDFIQFMRDVKSADKKRSSRLTKRDEKFALMAELPGWDEFKTMAYKKVDHLLSLRDYEAAGKSLEDLGLRFLVADMVSAVVDDLIRRVDQSKEMYEQEQKDNASRQKEVEKS